MPPDVRESVPSSHLVWTVLEVVEQLDTSVFHRLSRRGGAGRTGFDPDVLLRVLILGYRTGQRSTRQIERLCSQDEAFRVVCANQAPDHTVLARFRQNHEQAFEELFSEVLVMAAVRGLVRLDTVAVDGTKIAANATLDANPSEQWVRGLVRLDTVAVDGTKIAANATLDANPSEQWVREQAATILAEAQAVDAAEDELFGDARGDEPDPAMTDPVSREQAVRQTGLSACCCRYGLVDRLRRLGTSNIVPDGSSPLPTLRLLSRAAALDVSRCEYRERPAVEAGQTALLVVRVPGRGAAMRKFAWRLGWLDRQQATVPDLLPQPKRRRRSLGHRLLLQELGCSASSAPTSTTVHRIGESGQDGPVG